MVFTSTVSPLLKIGLRLICVWPNVRYAAIRWLLYVSSIIVVQYFQYLYLFAHFKLDEMQNLIDSLPATIEYSLTMIKLIALWTNRRVIHEMLVGMDTDWRECVNVDQHLRLMTAKASVTHFFSSAMFSFNTFVGAMFYIGDNVIAIIQQLQGNNDTTRPFPMKVLHASGQVDIICHELKNISEGIPYDGSSRHTMGILIERHNKVISFSENIDKLFSLIALMQIFLNTTIICALGIFVMASNKEIDVGLLKAVFAYGAIMMEIFIFCFVGEYLSFKSKSLADAAYNSSWYNMTSKQNKNLLFVIMRSQKQLSIMAGGMTNLSLEVFASIMKASASYMSILYAMY